MTRRLLVALLLSLAIAGVHAQKGSVPDELAGTWTGTWEGAGSGGFELVLEKGKEGPAAGRVTVTGEPAYEATFRALTFDGKKMSAAYDFPPESSMEIALDAVFDGGACKGTWVARAKANGEQVATGSFDLKQKK
jgi:hypothetical protein